MSPKEALLNKIKPDLYLSEDLVVPPLAIPWKSLGSQVEVTVSVSKTSSPIDIQRSCEA